MTGRRLTALVFLAACSMVLQYAAQGALAAGFNPREFGAWFWYADAVLWGLRALIDAAVIVSLFQTQARNSRDARLLAVFEVAMIGLITLTVGPAMVAIARGVAIDAVLSQGLRWAWSFGVAAYAPLMMGAAGAAYKITTAGAPLPAPVLFSVTEDAPEAPPLPAPAPFPTVTARERVLAYLDAQPNAPTAEVARACACSPAYVRKVRQ